MSTSNYLPVPSGVIIYIFLSRFPAVPLCFDPHFCALCARYHPLLSPLLVYAEFVHVLVLPSLSLFASWWVVAWRYGAFISPGFDVFPAAAPSSVGPPSTSLATSAFSPVVHPAPPVAVALSAPSRLAVLVIVCEKASCYYVSADVITVSLFPPTWSLCLSIPPCACACLVPSSVPISFVWPDPFVAYL